MKFQAICVIVRTLPGFPIGRNNADFIIRAVCSPGSCCGSARSARFVRKLCIRLRTLMHTTSCAARKRRAGFSTTHRPMQERRKFGRSEPWTTSLRRYEESPHPRQTRLGQHGLVLHARSSGSTRHIWPARGVAVLDADQSGRERVHALWLQSMPGSPRRRSPDALASLKSLYLFAMAEDEIEDNPVHNIKVEKAEKKLPQILTRQGGRAPARAAAARAISRAAATRRCSRFCTRPASASVSSST